MSDWINGWATKLGYSYGFVPTLWDARMRGTTNPLLNLFSAIDIVFIFEVVLSLMALIFAYDAISGERERGTLRLVLTHPVRRGHILLAKYISAMICLLGPLLMSLLLAAILLITSTAISLNISDFLRIGGIILSSIVYLSVFYLIGMLISAVTHRTGTCADACYVRLGVLGVGVSKRDPCRDCPASVLARTYGFHLRGN